MSEVVAPFQQLALGWLHWTPGPRACAHLHVEKSGRHAGRLNLPLVRASRGDTPVAWRRITPQGRTELSFVPTEGAGWIPLTLAHPFRLPWGLVLPGGARRAA